MHLRRRAPACIAKYVPSQQKKQLSLPLLTHGTNMGQPKVEHINYFLITINPQKRGIPSLGKIKDREPFRATGEFYVKSRSGYRAMLSLIRLC